MKARSNSPRVVFTLLALALPAVAATRSTTSDGKVPAGDSNVSKQVDRGLADELGFSTSEVQSKLAPATGDQAFLRRVYLDLVGTLPTPTEIAMFTLDPSADKRGQLVDRLLADPRYGENWARYWRDVIFYRRASDRALYGYGAVDNFLSEAFNTNQSWDKIAKQFIVASGNVGERGETAMFMAQEVDTANVAAEMSRVFMGVQIACAQCHDHPLDHWKREEFHQFAAFFPRIGLRPIRVNGQQRGFEIDSIDSGGIAFRPATMRRATLEHYMPDLKNPSAEGKMIAPKFFATGDTLPIGTKDEERRAKLADWLASPDNPWFAKAMVNRLWSELVGEGFQEPVDDLSVDRPCSAPKTFDLLAAQFTAHGYDVKWLFRTIMATDAYARESRPRRNPNETPFLANCSYRLRSDVVYDCLAQALAMSPGSIRTFGGAPGAQVFRYLNSPRSQFGQVFGYDPSVRRETVAGSIPQALALMNSRQFAPAISADSPQSVAAEALHNAGDDNEQAVVELFLRVLAREPSNEELTICVVHIAAADSRAAGIEDVLWTLLNRTEFLQRN
ncbi:MAG TPA: DUF1549 domain-containing protein [Pirellulales bacterium]|nr:DUF1549 domain-containing protein [Pirellulales bacterium]